MPIAAAGSYVLPPLRNSTLLWEVGAHCRWQALGRGEGIDFPGFALGDLFILGLTKAPFGEYISCLGGTC